MKWWPALAVGLTACTAMTPPPEDAAIADTAVPPDLAVSASPDMAYAGPDLLITGVIAGKDLRGNSVKLGDGEWNLAGVPPEGTFAVVLSDDTHQDLWAYSAQGGIHPGTQIAGSRGSYSVETTASEGVYFGSGTARFGWWPSLGGATIAVGERYAVSPDGKWIAFQTDDGAGGSTLHYGPREGPFETRVGWSAEFAPTTGRVFLSTPSGLFSMPEGRQIADSTFACTNCELVAFAGDGKHVATIEPDSLMNRHEPDVVIRDGSDPSIAIDRFRSDYDFPNADYLIVKFFDGTSLLAQYTEDWEDNQIAIGHWRFRDYSSRTDADTVGESSEQFMVASSGTLMAFQNDSLICWCDDAGAALMLVPTVQLASYSAARFLSLSIEGNWALTVDAKGGYYYHPDRNRLLVHASSGERVVANVVSDDVTWDSFSNARDSVAWKDEKRLFFIQSSTLNLLDTSVDPWTVSPVADHVGQYIFNAATNRLFYTVRNAGSDDGIYVKSL